MSTLAVLPRYDRLQSYDWNYAHAPSPVEVDVPAVAGNFEFCGLKVPSPLGIAAGPLLNGRWVRYYASLGFDVLTYKTVRSRERACYPLPNLVPVDVDVMSAERREVPAVPDMRRTWAVSFGMPSKTPEVWRADVAETRRLLAKEKVLVVSVVATEQPGWTIDDMADDYALCARWAVESGADAVETNFSCPNVCTSDGQLYQHPREAAICAARVREAIGRTPFIVKVGHLRNRDEAAAMVDALAPHVDALAMTNSVAARVAGNEGLLFEGGPRGICGAAILEPSIAQTRLVRQVVNERLVTPAIPEGPVREEMERILAIKASVQLERAGRSRTNNATSAAPVAGTDSPPAVRLIGVGGAFTSDDVRRYLVAGAESVHLATAAMVDPTIGLTIRGAW